MNTVALLPTASYVETHSLLTAIAVERIKTAPIEEACRIYARLWAEYDEIDVQRKKILAQLNYLDNELMPQRFQDAGIKSINVEGVGRVGTSVRWTASIIKEMKDKAFAWLRANKHGDLIQETVNANTLAAWAKGQLNEEGFDPPEELFKIGTAVTTTLTREKGK